MTNFAVCNFQPISATTKEQQPLESYKHYVDELFEIQGVKWVYKSTNESKSTKKNDNQTPATEITYQRYKKARTTKLWTRYYICHRAGDKQN
jgi:hypothetical protein